MPVPVPEQLIRGTFVRVLRRNLITSAFELNKILRADFPAVYNPVSGADVNRINTELKKGPYPLAGMVQFSFGYWYNYFFKELHDRHKLLYASYAINDDGSFRTEASVAEKPWKTIFKEMLDLGFKAFEAKDHLTAEQTMAHASSSADNVLQALQVKVLFRGDGRLPDMIQKQGGTARQSRVDVLRTERNMAQDWHPFRTEGNKIWVRNGSNMDNCLFTAVSITPQFEVATKFPLLDDLRGSSPGSIGYTVAQVRPRDAGGQVVPHGGANVAQNYLAGVAQKKALVDTVEKRTLLASRTNVYCVRMRDVYNTQNYQVGSTFPEYATTRISWMDHYLWLAVTRVHFDALDGNKGHLIVITDHKWLQDQTLMSNVLLGANGVVQLRNFANDVIGRASLVGGVGGIAYTPPGIEPPFDIVSISELFVPGRPPATAPQGPVAQPQKVMGKVNIPSAFTHPR